MIVQSFKALQAKPKIWHKVVVAWVCAFLLASPQLFIFKETQHVAPDGHVVRLCLSKGYTAQWQRKTYFTFLTAYILIVPLGVMIFCYFAVAQVVWKPCQIRRTRSRSNAVVRSTCSSGGGGGVGGGGVVVVVLVCGTH